MRDGRFTHVQSQKPSCSEKAPSKSRRLMGLPPLPRLRAQLRLSHSEPTGGDTPRIILRQGASVVKDTGERQ